MKESKIELTHYFHPHDNFYTLRSVHKKCIHQIDFWVEPRFYQPRIHGALNLALHHCVSKRVTTGGYPYRRGIIKRNVRPLCSHPDRAACAHRETDG